MEYSQVGLSLISDERREQLQKHGRSIQFDMDANCMGQLAEAAGMLCYPEISELKCDDTPLVGWDQALWEKMVGKDYQQRLVIAGALIVAELDRLENMPKQS